MQNGTDPIDPYYNNFIVPKHPNVNVASGT